MIKILAIIVMLLSFSIFYLSQNKAIENLDVLKPYKERVCKEFDGKVDVVLADGTKLSCLSDEFAIEVGFAKNWEKLVGQTLYSSEISGKKPAIAIVDSKDITKLKTLSLRYDIKIITLDR